jgi:hypothetical protein
LRTKTRSGWRIGLKRRSCALLAGTESVRGPVNARVAAAEETVAQHTSDKQKDHDGQKHDKQKRDEATSGRPWLLRGFYLLIGYHQHRLSAALSCIAVIGRDYLAISD